MYYMKVLEGWNTILSLKLDATSLSSSMCRAPKVATSQDLIPSRVDFLMDHSMGWLSRFFSTKSGGPFQATIPPPYHSPLPIQCIVKQRCSGYHREHNNRHYKLR